MRVSCEVLVCIAEAREIFAVLEAISERHAVYTLRKDLHV